MKSQPSSLFSWFITACVVASVAGGLLFMQSPTQVRLKKIDNVRVSNLRALENTIVAFHRKYKKLPESLEEMRRPDVFPVANNLKDPTGKAYEYRKIDDRSYELCAFFDTDTLSEDESKETPYTPYQWPHKPGRYCFGLNVEEIPLPSAKP